MKYKHIHSAIHNFGDSFLSLMNYVDGGYVIDELTHIHAQGLDIEVDWLSGRFQPEAAATGRIKKSVAFWCDHLRKHLESQRVELTRLKELRLLWPARGRKYMRAIDDRGKEYKIFVQEYK
jgi:hypothetical protein